MKFACDWPPCVQCGYCCTQSACSYGTWDSVAKRCVFLTAENRCAKYGEINSLEKDDVLKMFGGGCSSSLFNPMRDAKLKAAKR